MFDSILNADEFYASEMFYSVGVCCEMIGS